MNGWRYRIGRCALITSLAAASASASPTVAQETSAKRIVHITAERFSFTPSELTVAPGTTVEIRLTSEDTAHGFRLTGPQAEQSVNVVIPKRGRGEAVVSFTAGEPGDYVFECSRMCGAGHSFMRGRIRVKDKRQ